VGLGCLVSRGAEVGGGRAALGEEAGENWLDEGAEDNLSTTGRGETHPENENEFEGVVEGEPIDGVDGTLEDAQERIDDPVGQPLRVIGLTCAEKGVEGVVAWEEESGKIDQELSSDVEEHQKEVDSNQAEESVDLGHGSLSLEIVEHLIFGELLINLAHLVLCTILERHDDGKGSSMVKAILYEALPLETVESE